MSKELELSLFNIYDVVVFEDENGITQDCVCSIGKDKEVDKIVDIIGCNNNIISIYDNGSYTVWERDGKNLPYYSTNKKIIHLYTLKNDNRLYEVYPTNDYGMIEKVNHSNSLECSDLSKALNEVLRIIDSNLTVLEKEKYNTTWLRQDFTTIKNYILKAQEQEQMLNYLMKFVKDVTASDNGEYYISFKNDTPYLDCIEIDKEHYNKFKNLKESKGE